MELLPAIDLMNSQVVRLLRGDPKAATIYSEDPPAMARQWEAAGADIIHIVDLDAALGINGGGQTELIKRMVSAVRIPIQVGGGVRSVGHATDLFAAGVRKVVLGTMAFKNQPAMHELLLAFGAERIVVALDYAEDRVMIKGWQEATALTPMEALKQLLNLGVRQFLMTAISQDGTLAGADVEVLAKAAEMADAEIYASGGVATVNDVRQFKHIGVKGFIIGKALYEGTLTMEQLRHAIAEES